MAPNQGMRASDADREQVATALRQHLADGRITLDEFDERLDGTYKARTYGELDAVLVDLPRTGANPLTATDALAGPQQWGGGWSCWPLQGRRRRGWSRYVRINVICWAIWGATFASSRGHDLQGLWPIWVSLPWGFWKGSRSLEHRNDLGRRRGRRPMLPS